MATEDSSFGSLGEVLPEAVAAQLRTEGDPVRDQDSVRAAGAAGRGRG